MSKTAARNAGVGDSVRALIGGDDTPCAQGHTSEGRPPYRREDHPTSRSAAKADFSAAASARRAARGQLLVPACRPPEGDLPFLRTPAASLWHTELAMPLKPSGPADLENQLAFETLISDVSARLAAAPDQAFASTIEAALEETARFLGADRGQLLSVDAPPSEVRVSTPGAPTRVESSDRGVPASSFAERTPWAADLIVTKRQPLVMSALDELPPEAQRDRASFMASGVRSAVWVPVAIGPDLRYLLSVEATHGEVHWPRWLPHRLLRLGEILGHTVERQRVADALRETNARIALATSSADAGPWDLDLSTGRIWATPAAKKLYGFADERRGHVRGVSLGRPPG